MKMTRIAVWNCADEQLSLAKQEVPSFEHHRSREVDVVAAAQALAGDDLGKLIASVKSTIFHFIGHGRPRGELVVNEGRNTVARPIAAVLKVVRAASSDLEGECLSGCYSSVPGPESL